MKNQKKQKRTKEEAEKYYYDKYFKKKDNSKSNLLNKNFITGTIVMLTFIAIFLFYQFNEFKKYKSKLNQLAYSHPDGLLPLSSNCIKDPLKKALGNKNNTNKDCNLDFILNKIENNLFSFLLKEETKNDLINKINLKK